MAVLRSLVTTLGLNSAQYRAELKRASSSTQQWSGEVEKHAKRAAQMFYTYVAVKAVGAVKAMYDEQAAAIDQQAKFADKIGISTDALAGLQHAGELTGVATNQLNTGIQRMTRRIAEAAQGTGEAKGAIEALGLSAQALAQLTPDQQFHAIAEAMGNVEGKSEKLRLAFKLFDSEGTALLNTLDMGADGLRGAATEAENYGIALSRVDAQKVEDANDQVYHAGLLSQGFAKHLTAELAPIVQGVADEFLGAANAAGEMGEVATQAVDYIVRGLDVVYAGLLALKNGWNVVKWATLEAARWGVEALRALEYDLKAFLNMLPGIEMQMSESLGNSLTWLRNESKAALNDMVDSSTRLADQFVAVFDGSGAVKVVTDRWRDAAQATAEAKVATKEYGATLEQMSDVKMSDIGITGLTDDDLQSQLEKNQLWIDQLNQRLMTEKELIDAQAIAERERVRQEITDEDQKQQALYAIKTNWQNKIGNLRAKEDAALKTQQQKDLKSRSKLFGDMADLTGAFAGEQSAAYKGLFAASKAFSIAQTISASFPAIAEAWASAPFPANLPAVATVTAETGALTAAAQAVQLTGMAHSGIDYVPSEGTWLLDQGERVVDRRTNEDLKAYLANSSSGKQSTDKPNWQIIINEAPPGTTASIDDTNQIITIAVKKSEENLTKQLMFGGAFVRAGQQYMGWRRKP